MVRHSLFQRWRRDALAIFKFGVKAVDPATVIPHVLKREQHGLRFYRWQWQGEGRVWIFGAGKASARMAQVVESVLGEAIAGGLVITKEGHRLPTQRVEVREAAHPIPDNRSVAATKAMIERMAEVARSDLVLFLLSGGASALLEWPREPIELDDLRLVTDQLLRCGASIHEINAVRKHLSRVKGGQLLRYLPGGTVWTMMISDVVGGRPDSIGSGPTVPDTTTFEEVRAILDRYGLWQDLPPAVRAMVRDGCQEKVPETPKPGDPLFRTAHARIIADNQKALVAAVREARSRGYHAMVLSGYIEGETHETARFLVSLARQVHRHGQPIRPPACLLMGGETTLVVRGEGRGGRNQEFALYAGTLLEDEEPIVILSAGTDGTDGPTDAAGGIMDVTLVKKAAARGIDPVIHLKRNDAYPCLETLGGLIRTGPTYTNVMDIMLALIGRA